MKISKFKAFQSSKSKCEMSRDMVQQIREYVGAKSLKVLAGLDQATHAMDIVYFNY